MKENIKIIHPFRIVFSNDQCEWVTAQMFNGQMLQTHVLTGMCNKSLFSYCTYKCVASNCHYITSKELFLFF